MKKTKQNKSVQSFTKLMMPYVLENKMSILIVLILVVLSNALLLAIPVYTGTAIDSMIDFNVDFETLYKSVILVCLLAFLGYLCEAVRGILMVKVSQKIVYNLRRDVFSHLLKLKLSFVEDSSRGDIINRVSIDIDQISTVISSDLITVITSIVTIIIAFFMMIVVSPYMTLIYVLIIPALIVISRKISARTKRLYSASKRSMGIMSGKAEENFAADKTVKMFALEDNCNKEFDDLSLIYRDNACKSEAAALMMMPSCNLINNLGFSAIAIVGCSLVMSGAISVGKLSQFILYSKKFSSPIVETSNIYNTFQSALSSSERILHILSSEPELQIETEDIQLKGDIKFENVSFSYDGKKNVLKNINLEVKPGEKVAIVGHTGCGKTTLISLLMRFYDVTDGKILVDGKDIKSYNLNNLRTNFGLVLQENFLFDMSILQNVDYGLDSNNNSLIKEAIKEVLMDTFIESLEKGYNTPLSYENTAISQGQIQLLVIARAMLLNPNIYIFDEATSNVDLITERKIKEVTNRIMDNKTAFIIAHRLSTINNCDKIIVMDAGEIIEMGNHEELLALKGYYYNLVNA